MKIYLFQWYNAFSNLKCVPEPLFLENNALASGNPAPSIPISSWRPCPGLSNTAIVVQHLSILFHRLVTLCWPLALINCHDLLHFTMVYYTITTLSLRHNFKQGFFLKKICGSTPYRHIPSQKSPDFKGMRGICVSTFTTWSSQKKQCPLIK